ncbi:MAG: Uma2 family endonuclease [Planctomycetes bacterium]|nr:Uma2 family endonuclease [Planctomycetota bacterium]
MSTAATKRLSPAEYLALERAAEIKSEYYDGEMFAMAGAGRRHNLIKVNIGRETSLTFKGRPCEIYTSDMRVKVDRTGLYTYPDVVIVCGEPEFEDAEVDTLLNPTVLCEVLSKTSEAYDRGRKFAHYRRLPSLKSYVLISQDRPRVEVFSRQADDRWLLTEYDGLEAVAAIPEIDCLLPLAEIYDRVDFDVADAG